MTANGIFNAFTDRETITCLQKIMCAHGIQQHIMKAVRKWLSGQVAKRIAKLIFGAMQCFLSCRIGSLIATMWHQNDKISKLNMEHNVTTNQSAEYLVNRIMGPYN